MTQSDEVAIYKRPEKLLQRLIRYNTTNPPGDEAECIKYIDHLLRSAGFETIIAGSKPERQNLVVRLKGSGESRPLLMYGHIDVVGVDCSQWRHNPFEGDIDDGCVWGRGSLDMKGAVAMMLSALIQAKTEGFVPKGDIILSVVCDEEDEGFYGARYMVEQHPGLFENVKYAIGEIGGFTMHMDGKRFYPVMISEKQKCTLKAVINGPTGHGSIPLRDGAMAKLGYVLTRLNNRRLPVHITPPAKLMIEVLASNLSPAKGIVLRQLLNPVLTDTVLNILGKTGTFFDPILHNTVNATIVRGGNKISVLPGEVTVEFDGRLLPGAKPEDIISELNKVLDIKVDFETTFYCPGPDNVDMGFFNTVAQVLRESDKEAIPIPFLVGGCTDARYYSRLGIQTYGFTPMILPQGMDYSKLIHGVDERIPVKALYFGTQAIYKLFERI